MGKLHYSELSVAYAESVDQAVTQQLIIRKATQGNRRQLSNMAELPNLRRLFIEARTEEEEREVSRRAFYNFILFVGSVAAMSLIAQKMHHTT